MAEYERRRAEFRAPPRLRRAGARAPRPDGAGDARRRVLRLGRLQRFSASSWDFCFDMMERAHVALTPGRDFGPLAAERYLRLSFASSMPQLQHRHRPAGARTRPVTRRQAARS